VDHDETARVDGDRNRAPACAPPNLVGDPRGPQNDLRLLQIGTPRRASPPATRGSS
jgi:hypothetical protein